MTAGARCVRWWASVGAVLLLFGCSHVTPTEPARNIPPRGKQEGPLPGVPEEQPFVEANVPPPPYPKDSNLAEFYLRGQTTNRFFIDTSSLSVGPDRIVRFALVIRTPENTETTTFSGLRCSEKEWKDYAYGGSDRAWSVEPAPQWRRIQELSFNNYRGTLYQDYLCVGSALSAHPAGDAAKLVRLLKYPPPKDNRNPTKRNL
jgi:CNP1-like family protein